MRNLIPISAVLLSAVCHGQTVTKDPNQQMREEVTRWVETMSRIQKEESEWARDREVLANYKEGLRNEIESLQQAITEAQERKGGADKKTQEISVQHEQYATARSELALQLQRLEKQLVEKFPLFPKALATQPKAAVAMADLQKAAALTGPDVATDVSKRLYNLVELLAEVEKFHQQIHLTSELHKDGEGREFKIQVVYFGLAMAYGVNEDNTFAVVGTPTRDGWKFTERTELAPRIQELVAAANEPKVATFTPLPLIKP